jgi:ATP-dependent protease HslVU (ClpYQ) peptidase subunit
MTTIAFRDGLVAADSALSNGNTITIGATKIAKRPSDGAIIAATGSSAYNAAFMRWALADEPDEKQPKRPDDNTRALIYKAGTIWIFESTEPSPPYQHDAPYYAAGSGMDFAIGAMAMGATAEQAVEVAVKHDAYTRGPIIVLSEGLRMPEQTSPALGKAAIATKAA